MDTKNKIALITGGSRGIGRSAAIHMAQKGLDVIITYNNNKQAADEVVSEIHSIGRKAAALQLDTRNVKSFDSFFGQLEDCLRNEMGGPKFDFLINNAGTALYSLISDTTEEQLDAVYHIHFKGVYLLIQKALKLLNDGGGIVNVSSGLTRFSNPGSSGYASMKGAVEVLTRYMAKELGPRRIRANAVAPGAIATDFGGGRTREK